MSRRALQPLISIDLFWRQFVARRVCGQEGRGLGWGGGVSREVELPGGRQASWAWAWPFVPPRLPQPRRWGFVCALPARTVGRKPRCAAGGHGVTAALSSVLELDSS